MKEDSYAKQCDQIVPSRSGQPAVFCNCISFGSADNTGHMPVQPGPQFDHLSRRGDGTEFFFFWRWSDGDGNSFYSYRCYKPGDVEPNNSKWLQCARYCK